ncbi:hypothetical protein AC249_AIPGENE108 [Exaiptasia diaphana]|nr:hypothetical protein AC249_AIPGENE108 [Exaiptasia diaphana]
MSFRLGKNFIISRNGKRININENDLNLDRLSAVFKVVKETLYLEDMQRNIFFPDQHGKFQVEEMDDMAVYLVEGDQTDTPAPAPATTTSYATVASL